MSITPMFKFTLSKCSEAASVSKFNFIRAKSGAFRRNPADTFGLLGKHGAPQTVKLLNSRWTEQFKGKSFVKIERASPTVDQSSRSTIPKITVPATVSNKKRKKLEVTVQSRKTYERLYAAPKGAPVIIECSRPEYNHYLGQRYPSPKKLMLLSELWKQSKKNNKDWLIIRKTQRFPKSMTDESDRHWEFFMDILDVGLVSRIRDDMHFRRPTTIQFATFEQFTSSLHMFIGAETGSGKTIAYGAPILSQLIRSKAKGQHPKAVILVVTSFLRKQTARMLSDMVNGLSNAPKIVEGTKTTSFASPDDFDVLVATPARATSLLRGLPGTYQVTYVVMDESDMMMDDSFVDSVSEFLTLVPVKHSVVKPDSSDGARVIFSSATATKELQDLMEGIVESSQTIYVKSDNLHRLLPNVEQRFYRVSHPERRERLKDVIEHDLQLSSGRTLVFCRDTKSTHYVASFLDSAGVSSYVMAKKKSAVPDDARVIVSTDVGGRGLDIPDLHHVVNYDFPRHMVDYVHRMGRVGRCNASKRPARVTSFVRTDLQIAMVNEIEKSTRLNRPLETIETDVSGLIRTRRSRFQQRTESAGIAQ